MRCLKSFAIKLPGPHRSIAKTFRGRIPTAELGCVSVSTRSLWFEASLLSARSRSIHLVHPGRACRVGWDSFCGFESSVVKNCFRRSQLSLSGTLTCGEVDCLPLIPAALGEGIKENVAYMETDTAERGVLDEVKCNTDRGTSASAATSVAFDIAHVAIPVPEDWQNQGANVQHILVEVNSLLSTILKAELSLSQVGGWMDREAMHIKRFPF
jgi:hypothetical protein